MKRVSDSVKSVSVTGKFIGMYADGKPFLVLLEGTTFLPIFSTAEKLEESFEISRGEPYIFVKQITDHKEFIESVPGVRLMLYPWITEQGNTRFTEICNDPTVSAN